MKIRCNDGKVRHFQISKIDPDGIRFFNEEAKCLECGEEFGMHDTRVLKPMFKEHVCKKETSHD